MDVGSRAVHVASYVLFGKIFNFIVLGIALILVTRLLGPGQYGYYTLATAFASIFSVIGYFGVGSALQKFMAQYQQEKKKDEMDLLISNALVLVVISGLVMGAIFIMFDQAIASYVYPHSQGMGYLIEAITAWIIIVMFFGTFYDALVGLGNGKAVAIVVSVQALFQAAISIGLSYEWHSAIAPIYGLIFGYLLGFFAGLWIVFKQDQFSFRMPSYKYIKRILGFSAPLALSSAIGGFVGNLGLIYLGYFVLTSVIGNMGVAARTNSLLSVIFDSISVSILPAFSAALANRGTANKMGKIYSYTVYLAILLVSPLLFYIAALATPFSYSIFGSGYAYAPLYISIAAIGLLIGIAGSYASTLLISSGKVKPVLTSNVIVYLIALVLFIMLLPTFKGMGYALITFILLPFMLDVAFIRNLSRLYRLDFRIRKMIGILISNAILFIALILLGTVIGGIGLLAVGAALVLAAYPLLAVFTGGADIGDINTLKELSHSIPSLGIVLRMLADYASIAIR